MWPQTPAGRQRLA